MNIQEFYTRQSRELNAFRKKYLFESRHRRRDEMRGEREPDGSDDKTLEEWENEFNEFKPTFRARQEEAQQNRPENSNRNSNQQRRGDTPGPGPTPRPQS